MKIKPTTLLKRGEDYIYNNVDGELVMMNINTGLYISVNDTGKEIWTLLEEPRTLDYILNEIGKLYNVSPEQCETDVVPFMRSMLERKLIIEV